MEQCSKCGKILDKPLASISGSIMGDEYTDSFYFCEACIVFTKKATYEPFAGEESSKAEGPLTKDEGEARIEQINKCSTPRGKKCRCPVHMAYFNNTLD